MNDKERDIIEKFQAIKSDLEHWGRIVDDTLMNVLSYDNIEPLFLKIRPEFRLKKEKSYLDKALYRYQEYSDPLLEIIDKVATRVVVLKSDQISKVASAIETHLGWKATVTKDLKQLIENMPTAFGYQSMHVVVEPLQQPQKTTTDIKYLTCEIQIRTLLQHAFAEVSHDSVYKGPYKNDREMVRHLSKSMALMEATDDYFCTVFSLMRDTTREFYHYTEELVRLYQKIMPGFKKSDINIELTERIYSLMEDILKIELQDLDTFIQKNEDEIKRIMIPKHGELFQQPAGLLIFYYFQNNRTRLRKQWPFTQESLKSVYAAFNTAFDYY